MNNKIQFPKDHVIKIRGNGVCNHSIREVASEGSVGLLCQANQLDQCQVSERLCLKEQSRQHLRNTRSCPLAFIYTCTHVFMNILRHMYAYVHTHMRMCVRTNAHPLSNLWLLFYDFCFSVCISFKKSFKKKKKENPTCWFICFAFLYPSCVETGHI